MRNLTFFVLVAAATACAQWGLNTFGLDHDDVAAVEAGLAAVPDPEAAAIVDRLDVFGWDLEEVPAKCRLNDFSIVEGCAVTPGSNLARARIHVARDRDDLAATTAEELEHLVHWDAPHGCDPADTECLDDHAGEPTVAE